MSDSTISLAAFERMTERAVEAEAAVERLAALADRLAARIVELEESCNCRKGARA